MGMEERVLEHCRCPAYVVKYGGQPAVTAGGLHIVVGLESAPDVCGYACGSSNPNRSLEFELISMFMASIFIRTFPKA